MSNHVPERHGGISKMQSSVTNMRGVFDGHGHEEIVWSSLLGLPWPVRALYMCPEAPPSCYPLSPVQGPGLLFGAPFSNSHGYLGAC